MNDRESSTALHHLAPAVRDYRLFLERGYPESTLKKVVGDRHRLSGEERLILFRGVATEETDRSRNRKILSPDELSGKPLAVDFYNVAFTILNYRLGRPVFRATDGYLRDAGALHGRLGRESRLDWVLTPLIETLLSYGPGEVVFYLDSPVSHSGDHARSLKQICARYGRPHWRAEVVPSADYPLRRNRSALIATGDSAIIDECTTGVVDLAALVLKERFDLQPPDLASLLG